MTFSFVSVQPEPGDDPEVVRAKYFIRDEFLVRKVCHFIHLLTLSRPMEFSVKLYTIKSGCSNIYNIYILNVAALDENIIPSCLHFSMQNIE